jgi:hypothetical protein
MQHSFAPIAALTAAVVLVANASSAQAQGRVDPRQPQARWVAVGVGDCTGRDWASSRGATPNAVRCTAQTAGRVAVCWDNVRYRHPRQPYQWCTYKTVSPTQCRGGAAPGTMYVCQLVGAPGPGPGPGPAPGPAKTQTFPAPTVNGLPLSNCLDWGRGCGQPAADSFCRKQGFVRAQAYSDKSRPGKAWIPEASGGRNTCNDPGCGALTNVVCTR